MQSAYYFFLSEALACFSLRVRATIQPGLTDWRARAMASEPRVVLLDEPAYLDVREIGPRLAYTKKWPPEHWRLAFQGNLHQIPEEDYKLILSEMREPARR